MVDGKKQEFKSDLHQPSKVDQNQKHWGRNTHPRKHQMAMTEYVDEVRKEHPGRSRRSIRKALNRKAGRR